MATTVNNTKYFYPPRPGSGAATFSDNIVGLQLVDGGGLTQGNFEFTTKVVDKVNRNFGVGAFSNPINLEDLNINHLINLIKKARTLYPSLKNSRIKKRNMYERTNKYYILNRLTHMYPQLIKCRFPHIIR